MPARLIDFPREVAYRPRRREGGRRGVFAGLSAGIAVLSGVLAAIAWRSGEAFEAGPLAVGLALTALLAAAVSCVVCFVPWLETASRRHPRDHGPTRARGLEGERFLSAFLARELPEGYVILNNLRLPGGRHEIDHVVVGATVVWVLETKNMDGFVTYWGDEQWQRVRTGRRGGVSGAPIGDPSGQARRNANALGSYLRAQAPELVRALGLRIEPLVVFVHPQVQLDVGGSPVSVVRPEGAVRIIVDNIPNRSLHPEQTEQIVDVLLRAGRAQEVAGA